MLEVDILLTESEMKALRAYAVKSFGSFFEAGFKTLTEEVIPVASDAYMAGYRCQMALPVNMDSGELLVKVVGGHVSCSNKPVKEQLLGRCKYLIKCGEEIKSLDLSILSREQRLLLERIQLTLSERNINANSGLLIKNEDFIQKCNTLLHRHFLIDGAVDSINATSEAVFHYCAGIKPKSHKAQHWIAYLDTSENSESLSDVINKVMQIALINPSLNDDISGLLNADYIDRTQANRLATLIDASLLSSSVRIREDFVAQVLEIEPSTDIKVFNGIVFGITQSVSDGKPRFALRVKSESGQLLEVESGSEYFGGLISKKDLMEIVRSQLTVRIEGVVTSVNNGIKLGERVIFPAITSVSAKKLLFKHDAPKEEHHQIIIKRNIC